MIKYLFGMLINIFNFRISKLAKVDYYSKVDKKAKIYRGCRIYKSKIDAYTYIAPNSSVVNAKIGKFCSISQNVFIGLPQHNMNVVSTSPIFLSKKNAVCFSWTKNNKYEEHANVIIGNDVWIGMNVLIKGGVTIKDGAIIGAGSIVTKDIPAYAVVVGTPAKIIKYRFSDDIICKLVDLKWWNFSEKHLKDNIDFFSDEKFYKYDLLNELKL